MPHRRTPARLARLVVLLLAATVTTGAGGCASASVSGPWSAERLAYLSARARWAERGPARYGWVYQRGWCECLPEWTLPIYVEVDGPGQVRVYDAETRAPITSGVRAGGDLPTVEHVFGVIADALERNAYRLRVEYHPLYGHPTLVEVDYDRQIADDEFRIETRDFAPR